MQRDLRISALITAALLGVGSSVLAEDWPRWRGPEGTNVSTESNWSTTGRADALWSMNVGRGYSSFVVRDGRVITVGHEEGANRDTVYCLDASSGEQIWAHGFPSKIHNKFHKGGTLSTPTIDGDRVYALNREGRMMCLSFDDGSVHWERPLNEEYELTVPMWMFSASPLVRGDQVIVNVGIVLALDKNSGEEVWASRNTGEAYSTPVLMSAHGRDHMLVFNSEGLVVLDPSSGKETTSYPWKTKYDVNAATPIVLGNRIFISSGYNHGCAMLELTEDGLESIWESKEMRSHMSGCVHWEGHLYGFDDKTLKCLDLEGNEQWSKRGLGEGALMVADGKLIVLSSKGELIIADASPGGFAEVSSARVLESGECWASPVLVNGLIYCRNSEGDIVCRDHRTSSP